MSKKKNKQVLVQDTGELVTKTVGEGLTSGTAILMFLVKGLCFIIIMYLFSFFLVYSVPRLAAFIGAMLLGNPSSADTFSLICGAGVPAVMFGIISAWLWIMVARFLATHLVKKPLRNMIDALKGV